MAEEEGGNSKLKVPFGEKDGRLFLPQQVENGKKCGCFCPNCGSKLLAKKRRDTHFFAHYESQECKGGYETAIHKMAIQIIEGEGRVTIPSLTKDITSHVIDEEYLISQEILPSREVIFQSVVSERNVSKTMRLRPDLTATLANNATLYIEVMYRHAVETLKAETLDNVMEINLSRITHDEILDLDTFKRKVLEEADRYWYRCSLYDEIPRIINAQAKLDELALEKREQRLTERHEREQREKRRREDREKRRTEQDAQTKSAKEQQDKKLGERRFVCVYCLELSPVSTDYQPSCPGCGNSRFLTTRKDAGWWDQYRARFTTRF